MGTIQDEVSSPTGFAMDGEVEDYEVQVKGQDLGDAGEDFPTLREDGGARHGLPENPEIYLGDGVDVDDDGSPSDDAGEDGTTGDDGADGEDDEDGLLAILDADGEPTMLITGEATTIQVKAVVPDGITGYLQVWIDFNDDGDWADAGEQIATDFPVTSATDTYDSELHRAI